jgi:Family of unknown function (DUF6308)
LRFDLVGGAVVYPDLDALATVCRYAFATVILQPNQNPRSRGAFPPHQVPLFAYRTYDCIPASPGPSFSDLDLLVIAGLNAGVHMPVFARLRSFADRAAQDFDTAGQIQPDFRNLSRAELVRSPLTGSAGWHLMEAWRQGMATPGLGVARVYKTLHHKRPYLFPLLDNLIIRELRPVATRNRCTIWQLIWTDLDRQPTEFQWLEDEFNRRADAAGTAHLSRLRLYDILLWMHVTGQRVSAPQGGTPLSSDFHVSWRP